MGRNHRDGDGDGYADGDGAGDGNGHGNIHVDDHVHHDQDHDRDLDGNEHNDDSYDGVVVLDAFGKHAAKLHTLPYRTNLRLPSNTMCKMPLLASKALRPVSVATIRSNGQFSHSSL